MYQYLAATYDESSFSPLHFGLPIVTCQSSEKLVTLNNKDIHDVPICHPVALLPSGQRKTLQNGPMKRNRFKCEALICKRCRCDVERGYKLSSEGDDAHCVQQCPITKYISSDCLKSESPELC
ncbi:unnamed protein product [Anisakis simplex]|uniref:Uncharacterized protein n=1 Tax=Anisakis simplex TaxID=6269 RepID=A0A0M3IY96_ANISI|nr:unnamed protein product [Anisakis simplex]